MGTGSDKKIIAAEKADFERVAETFRTSIDPKVDINNITIEEYIITAFSDGKPEQGKLTAENKNTGMLAHLDEYAEKLRSDGSEGFVDKAKENLRKLTVSEFFSEHIKPFSDFIREKGYTGYTNKWKNLNMVGKRFSKLIYPNLKIDNPVPLQLLKDLESNAPVQSNPKSTPFLVPQSDKFPEKGMTIENLDLALDKLDSEISLADQKINEKIDPLTGEKLTSEQIDSLLQRRDKLHAGRTSLIYQLHTGQRGSEAFSLYLYNHKANTARDANTKNLVTVESARAIDNTQYSTFQKVLSGNTRKYYIDVPEQITKVPGASFSVEIDPRVGVILDAQAERIERMVLNGKSSRSLFAYGTYKNGKLVEINDAFDYTYADTKTSKKGKKTVSIDTDKAFDKGLKNFLYGENGILAIAGISWNEDIVFDDPETGRPIRGAAQNYFNDHDIRGTLITYSNHHKSRIREIINTNHPNNPIDLDEVLKLIDYATGRDALNDINKEHYVKNPRNVEMKRWIHFSEALSELMLEDSVSLQKLTASSMSKLGYNPELTGKKNKKTDKIPLKNVEWSADSSTGGLQSKAKEPVSSYVFNKLVNLTRKQKEEYNHRLKNIGQQGADNYYNEVTKPKFDPTMDFMGTGTMASAVTQQMGEISSDFKAGKHLAAVGKSLPFVGPAVGLVLGAYYYSKPLSDYAITGEETEEELRKRRWTRVGGEVGSGFSPIPEPAALNIANVLPGEQNLNIMSAAEAIAPTRAEVEEREKSGSLIFKNPVKDVVDNTQQQEEVVKPQNNGNSIYDQMNSLMRNSIIDTSPKTL